MHDRKIWPWFSVVQQSSHKSHGRSSYASITNRSKTTDNNNNATSKCLVQTEDRIGKLIEKLIEQMGQRMDTMMNIVRKLLENLING